MDVSGRGLPVVSLAILAAILLAAALAPLLAPADPNQQALRSRLRPPLSRGTTAELHLFGTDQLGRDVFSRVLYGARVSLTISAVSVAVAAVVGFVLGIGAGFSRGMVDVTLMRLVDLQLAFPVVLLVMVIIALLGSTVTNIVAVFVLASWPTYARVVRASVMALMAQDFVASAVAMGNPGWRLVMKHVAPNVLAPVLIIASFEVSRMIILESAIGFLGLGIPPPTPTWGNMLADGRAYIVDAWWLTVLPGAAIMLTAASVNFVADGIRDRLDPRFKE